MNIVFAANNSYMEHLAVTLVSILINSDKEDKFTFYILSNDISKKSKHRLEKLKRIKDFEINYIEINNNDFENFPTRMHLTEQAYYRLQMSELISEDRVLYLDSDIIVRKSLKDLYNTDLKGNTAAVVEDIMIGNSGNRNHKHRAEILSDNYFNSGVMLWDLNKSRDEDISQKCFDFIKNNRESCLYCDQDPLNFVLNNSCLFLDKKYNFQYNPFYKLTNEIYQKHNKEIVILHFASCKKPWNSLLNLEFSMEYLSYAIKTPWRGNAIKNIFSIIKQKLKKTIIIIDCYL